MLYPIDWSRTGIDTLWKTNQIGHLFFYYTKLVQYHQYGYIMSKTFSKFVWSFLIMFCHLVSL